jgi:glycosyltransferase involved in cell wall biosynthesis
MKIAVYPSLKSKGNKYSELMSTAITACGYEAKDFNYRDLLTGNEWKDTDYFQFNWFENCNSLKEFTKKTLSLIFLSIKQKKIIFILHNKKVHSDTFKRRLNYSSILMKWLFRYSYKIVIHSKESINYIQGRYKHKVIYIPHPNYINTYGGIVDKPDNMQPSLSLLFLGAVRKYKNIELLIDVISKYPEGTVSLTIAGRPYPAYYEKTLGKHLKDSKNITTVFRFIEDNEIPSFLAQCDLLILPYDVKSSLNSGSIILAFSYKKTVISPKIGTLTDMQNDKFFTYEYKNEAEHIEQLHKIIDKAIELKFSNPAIFDKWGEIMYEEIKQENSMEVVQEKIKMLYS